MDASTPTTVYSAPIIPTPVTIRPPRPTFSCNGTSTDYGLGHECISTPSCSSPEVTGMVTTMNIYGRYVIECSLTGSVSATPGTVSSGGVETLSLNPSTFPIPIPSQSLTMTTTTVSSSVGSSASSASPSSNAGAEQLRPGWKLPIFAAMGFFGAKLCMHYINLYFQDERKAIA